MIDEKARRLPGFNEDESVPVAFGDGQDWFLPRPTVDVFALFENGKARRNTVNSFGAEFQAKIDAFEQAADDGFLEIATLAADLLRRNYDFPDADLGALLTFRAGDKESHGWINAVYRVAIGREAPKASAGGSA